MHKVVSISPAEGASTTRKFALANGLDAAHTGTLATAVSDILQHLQTIPTDPERELTMKTESGRILINIFFPSHLVPLDIGHVGELPSWVKKAITGIDRVFFGRQGRLKVIRLVMYLRETGKESEAWFMGLSPAPSSAVHISRIETGKDSDSAGTVLENVETGKVLRLDPIDDFLVSKFNGSIKLRDIYMEAIDRFGLISPDRIRTLYLALESNGMLKSDSDREDNHHIRKSVQRFIEDGIIFRRSNELLGSLMRKLGVLVGPLGAILLALIGISGTVLLILNGDRFISVFHGAGPYLVHHPLMLLILYAFVFLTTIMHELGHGLTCRHFGGRVDRMGFMLYLVMFIFFCDVSSAWGMKKRSQRILVSLGGPLVTFGILGACLWGFHAVSRTGSGLEIFFASAVMMEVFVLVMNLNPFLRMDAYYMLEDVLNVCNLRRNSFGFWKGLFAGRKRKESDGRLTARNRFIYLSYGLLGGGFTVFFVLYLLYSYSRELLMHHGSEGKIVLAAFMVLILLIRFGMKISRTLRNRTHWSREIS
jgi:putative peptide zinc metalloprotease protein